MKTIALILLLAIPAKAQIFPVNVDDRATMENLEFLYEHIQSVIGGSITSPYIPLTAPFLGDVTGPYSATVVGNDSHDHTAATLSGVATDGELALVAVSTGVNTEAIAALDLAKLDLAGGTMTGPLVVQSSVTAKMLVLKANGYNTRITNSPGQLYDNDFILPVSSGTSEQRLATDGYGNTYWANPAVFGSQEYYFTTYASDVSGYNLILSSYPVLATSTITYTTGSGAENVAISSHVSQVGYPQSPFIPAGSYSVFFRAKVPSGGKAVKIRAGLYERTTGGTETLLGYTNYSSPITGIEESYTLFLATGALYFSTGGRGGVKLFADFSASPANATTVEVYIMGSKYAHLSVPAPSVNVTNFLTYEGATRDVNIGAHNMTANAFYGDGSTLTGVITSTAALQADINSRVLSAGDTMTGALSNTYTMGNTYAALRLRNHSNGSDQDAYMNFENSRDGGVTYSLGIDATDNTFKISNQSELSTPIVRIDNTGIYVSGQLATSSSMTATGGFVGNVTGSASLNVLKAGDTMTGQLTLVGSSLTVSGKIGTFDSFQIAGQDIIQYQPSIQAASLSIGAVTPAPGTSPYNLLVGYAAGKVITGANPGGNVFIGPGAGYTVATGPYNTFVGALTDGAAAGGKNTVLGFNATTDGSENIAIGYGISTTGDNKLNIGGLITGDMSAPSLATPGSFTATTFYGSGSNLTGIITSTAAFVQKAGDTMTGQLTLSGSSLTVTGNAFSVGESALVVSGGLVGIGTPTLIRPLTVYGAYDGQISMSGPATNNIGFEIRSITAPSTTNNRWLVGRRASTDIFAVETWDGAAQTTRLGINGNTGNVGIGTTAPTDRLNVAGRVSALTIYSSGTVQATSFIGDGSGLTGLAGGGDVILAATQTFTGGNQLLGPTTFTGTINFPADGKVNYNNYTTICASSRTLATTFTQSVFAQAISSITITTAGEPVFLSWNLSCYSDTVGRELVVGIFRDGISIGADTSPVVEQPVTGTYEVNLSATWLDIPVAAGTYVYSLRAKVASYAMVCRPAQFNACRQH